MVYLFYLFQKLIDKIKYMRISNFKLNTGLYTFANPGSYFLIKKLLDSSSYNNQFTVCADGVSLVILENLFNKNTISRYSFDYTSIADEVFSFCVEQEKRVSIVGTTDENIGVFVDFLKNKYTNINISLFSSGFFKSDLERSQLIRNIADRKVDVVVVGMGSPYQEKFLIDLSNYGWKGYGFTCGGFIDQTVMKGEKYYPDIVNKLNLRWLYRLFKEPQRLAYRYLIIYPFFLLKYLRSI
ncbi:WecB/TagA/CpsF family glycosyltransferase [Celerinatantimonas sp. YJH-8]|uniref:WecB/TagA/CpsF family glycosyltransferase n=1 Tax=Celerinatantimonas sp. YJH-8 TaxID=3228714 RepID=UPI0038C4A373